MPNIKSAEKRMRQNAIRRAANRTQRSTMRTAVKKAQGLIDNGQLEEAKTQLPQTISAVDKAAGKGLIHKNKAARHASRLARKLNAAQAKKAGA